MKTPNFVYRQLEKIVEPLLSATYDLHRMTPSDAPIALEEWKEMVLKYMKGENTE